MFRGQLINVQQTTEMQQLGRAYNKKCSLNLRTKRLEITRKRSDPVKRN